MFKRNIFKILPLLNVKHHKVNCCYKHQINNKYTIGNTNTMNCLDLSSFVSAPTSFTACVTHAFYIWRVRNLHVLLLYRPICVVASLFFANRVALPTRSSLPQR